MKRVTSDSESVGPDSDDEARTPPSRGEPAPERREGELPSAALEGQPGHRAPLAPTRRLDDTSHEEADLDAFFGDVEALRVERASSSALAAVPGVPAAEPTLALLAVHREGVATIDLAAPRQVGRDPLADLSVDDSSLSRLHARFWVEQGAVYVEDLGSTNGTLVNGLPLAAQRRLEEADHVCLGRVAISPLPSGEAMEYACRIQSHDRLLDHASYELARSAFFSQPTSLILLRCEPKRGAKLVAWLAEVLGQLRPIDRVSVYSPHALMLLLPATNQEDGLSVARRIVGGPCARSAGLRAGLAVSPQHGASVDELLESCVQGLRRAGKAESVVSVDAQQRHAAPTLEIPAPSVTSASSAMREVASAIERIARSELTVLLTGETGTGKEVLARQIHAISERAERPFVVVDCAGIPKELAESMLFGHERGAFTGASEQRRGLFEQAEGGTILLDELGELSLELQPKLLRVLDSRELRRVGSATTFPINVRVIAATNRSLGAMVKEGSFRRDLHFRLGDEPIRLPPLRDRREDIEALGRGFLQAVAPEERIANDFSPAALELLKNYSWPGNIRELRNVVERAAVVAAGGVIDVGDLPPRIRGQAVRHDQEDASLDFKSRIFRYEKELIENALRACGGNQTQAAALLRMPLRTLVFKIKSFNLQPSA